MSLGKKSGMGATGSLWVPYHEVSQGPSHPFCSRLEKILRKHEFDSFCEKLYAPYCAEAIGRPSMPPGVYFRMLMIGYFEGVKSERGIAWKSDRFEELARLPGIQDDGRHPGDHSSLSRIRRRLSLEAHKQVFAKVLEILKKEGLLKYKKIGMDASDIEANAAMRCIRRRIGGKRHEAYLKAPAKESGSEEPTKEDPSRFERGRHGKSCSNKDWESPTDPEAKVTKMKDGRPIMSYYYCGRSTDDDCQGGGDLRIAQRTQTGWETATTETEGNTGPYTSIEVTNTGAIYISYYDQSQQSLKMATHR